MKLFTILAASACLYLFPTAVGAQTTDKPYVELTGQADSEVVPDRIYISVTLRERYDGKVKLELEKMDVDFMQQMKKLGIPDKDISLNNAEADFATVRRRRKDVLGQKTYQVKVGTARIAAMLLNAMEEIKIEEVAISRQEYADKLNLEKALRVAAVKNAQNKAYDLLGAVQQQPGKLLWLNEIINTQSYVIDGVQTRGLLMTKYNAGTESIPNVEFSKIKFTRSVTARFEIKQ